MKISRISNNKSVNELNYGDLLILELKEGGFLYLLAINNLSENKMSLINITTGYLVYSIHHTSNNDKLEWINQILKSSIYMGYEIIKKENIELTIKSN